MSRRRALAVPPLVLALLGCATHKPVEQRTTEGLAAEQLFVYRVVEQNGREPTFERMASLHQVSIQRIGVTGGSMLHFANAFEVSLSDALVVYEGAIPRLMSAGIG